MSMSHGHFKNAVSGKPLPTKRNPMTGKSDHSWVDHPLGHKWKFAEENTRSIKSFKDVFEAGGAIPRGQSAIDRMTVGGGSLFGTLPGGAPADPPKPKKPPKKKVIDRTKEFQDEERDIDPGFRIKPGSKRSGRDADPKFYLKPPPRTLDPDPGFRIKPGESPGKKRPFPRQSRQLRKEEDEAPVGDHSSDFKTYKYRDPRTGKFYDKQVKRKLDAWREQTELDEVPILAPVIAGIGRAALGAAGRVGAMAGRSIATAAGKTIIPALSAPHIAGKLVGSEDEEETETEKQKQVRQAKELLAKEMGKSAGQQPDQTSLQNARLESRITEALIRKAVESRVSKEVIYEVYNRGMDEHHSSKKAFDRVNSFINKGKARILDGDLLGEEQ